MAVGNRRKRINGGDEKGPATLADLQPGQPARVVAVDSGDGARLLKLAALGLVPGCTVRLQQRRPAYVLWVDETLLSMDRAVAATIVVRPI